MDKKIDEFIDKLDEAITDIAMPAFLVAYLMKDVIYTGLIVLAMFSEVIDEAMHDISGMIDEAIIRIKMAFQCTLDL